VTEAESPSGEQFGHMRLEDCVRRLLGKSSQEIMDGIAEEVRVFGAERGPSDDLTLMVVRVKAE